jgi:hypothetical protein
LMQSEFSNKTIQIFSSHVMSGKAKEVCPLISS